MLTFLFYSLFVKLYIKSIWLTDYSLLKPFIFIESSLPMVLISCVKFFFMLPNVLAGSSCERNPEVDENSCSPLSCYLLSKWEEN